MNLVETLGVERASGQYYLATPAVLKLRNDSPDGFVPPAVATERLEHGADIFDGELDAERLSPTPREVQA